MEEQGRHKAEVVVVGGGLSGLRAVTVLQEKGVDAILLEANSRFVGKTQDTLKKLADELGVERHPQYLQGKDVLITSSGSKTQYSPGGIPWVPSTVPLMPALPSLLDYLQAVARLESLAAKVPLDAPWTAPNAKELDRISLDTWEKQVCYTSLSKELMDIGNITVIGETHGVSLLHFLFFLHSCSGKYDLLMQCKDGAQEERFVGGSHSLSVKLAEKMREGTLFLDMPVLQIQQHDQRDSTGEKENENEEQDKSDKADHKRADEELVDVICKDGSRFTCSYVIVAVPPNQASRIHFTPPLPAAKSHLLHGIQMAAAIKTVTLYSRPWWREKGLNGNLACSLHNTTNNPIVVTIETTDRDEEGGALAGFIIGDNAMHWAKKTAEERRRAVLNQYARQFGCEEALDAVDYIDQVWMDQEWSRGCVAFMPPGVLSAHGEAIRTPVGRVHWAGTETATVWSGYMDGAVSAGERAAGEVLALLPHQERS